MVVDMKTLHNIFIQKRDKLYYKRLREKLWDLVSDTSHDMEDLIETISDTELKRLIEVWEKFKEEDEKSE